MKFVSFLVRFVLLWALFIAWCHALNLPDNHLTVAAVPAVLFAVLFVRLDDIEEKVRKVNE